MIKFSEITGCYIEVEKDKNSDLSDEKFINYVKFILNDVYKELDLHKALFKDMNSYKTMMDRGIKIKGKGNHIFYNTQYIPVYNYTMTNGNKLIGFDIYDSIVNTTTKLDVLPLEDDLAEIMYEFKEVIENSNDLFKDNNIKNISLSENIF